MEFLRNHQLNVMLFLSGVCAVLAVLAFFTKSLAPLREDSLSVTWKLFPAFFFWQTDSPTFTVGIPLFLAGGW